MNRRFDRKRRRQPLASWGFLTPHLRNAEDKEEKRQHLLQNPKLYREYRRSLVMQLFIIGTLLVSCLILLVQMIVAARSLAAVAVFKGVAWVLPVLIAFFCWAIFRRFIAVVHEFRDRRGE